MAFAQSDRTDPRSEDWRELPEMGRMVGTLKPLKKYTGEEYGRRISPLGDINKDGRNDWAIGRYRSDTLFYSAFGNAVYAEEFLIYLGVRGGLPAVGSGRRIGPEELDVRTTVLCAGDFDADGNRDIVCRFGFINDTSFGNQDAWETQYLVVYWGDGSGVFSNRDTTHLSNGTQIWVGIASAGGYDLSGDGIDDLLVIGRGGMTNGERFWLAEWSIFRGDRNRRWGRNGVAYTADWFWWYPPEFSRITNLDHDCDGARDLAMFRDNGSSSARVSVLYGRRNGFPDTTTLETADLTGANGSASHLIDVTGDGALDLLVNCGFDQMVRVYAGRPGQRLKEQYGTGSDPPIEGKGWWRRPWAEVWLPYKLHDGWLPAGFSGIFDLGDANGNRQSELWILSRPYLCGYLGGIYLDSLIDASIKVPGTQLQSIAPLGDIDGSGRPTVAIGYDDIPHAVYNAFPGGVVFVKPDPTLIPHMRGPHTLPHLPGEQCDNTAAIRSVQDRNRSDQILTAVPNPAGGDVRIKWLAEGLVGEGVLHLTDGTGREVWRTTLLLAVGEAVVPTSGLAAGAYFVSLESSTTVATVRVTIHQGF